MLELFRKRNGAISVFLTLILVPTLMFGGIIVDGVRIYGSKNIISGAGNLAMNGALANYDGSLNDAYGLIAMSDTPEELEDNLQDYFEASLNANGLTTEDFNKALIQLQLMEESFSANTVPDTEIWETAVMKQEILEYMKYRAPVTFVTRGIMGKVEQFQNIEKEKEAVDSQLKFESELEDLQDEFDALLEEVDKQKEVYADLPSTAEISLAMQATKDAYTKMCMLGIARDRLVNCPEAIEGETRALLEAYNDTAEGCSEGVDGFEALLKMQKIDNGMDEPQRLLDGLDRESEEYQEIAKELSDYDSNAEMWAEQVLQITEEYEELSKATKTAISGIYVIAEKGYESAKAAEEKLEKLKKKMEKTARRYETWGDKIEALPDNSTEKESMRKEHDQEVYKTLFGEDGADEFAERLENNKKYYEMIYNQLGELAFAGKKAVEIEGRAAIDPTAVSVSGQVNTQKELASKATEIFQGNWTGGYKLETGGVERKELESLEFVKYLRELAKSKDDEKSGQEKEKVDEWNDNLAKTLEEYKTLFLSDDIEKINIPAAGLQDIPSIWLSAKDRQEAGNQIDISGDMSDKGKRKKVSDSASGAMNTNNSSLSLFASVGDKLMSAAENVCVTEYIIGMFSYYTVNRDKDGKEIADPMSLSNMQLKENELYRAEVEYILWGSDESRDNITKTKALIYAIQFVGNAIFAFTNDELIKDARDIAGLFPVGPLAKIAIKAALLSVVTIIETTQDLNALVKGESVPFRKREGGWKTWIARRGNTHGSDGSLNMRYEDYLWIMIFVNTFTNEKSVLARTADCIELNQTDSKSSEEESMKEKYTMIRIQADVKTETFFLRKIAAEIGRSFNEDSYTIHYNGLQGY